MDEIDWKAKYKRDLHNFMLLEAWLETHHPELLSEWEASVPIRHEGLSPRTDAIVYEFPEDADPLQQTSLEAALISHARQLERELNEAWEAYRRERRLKLDSYSKSAAEYICKCGVRVEPHLCRTEGEW